MIRVRMGEAEREAVRALRRDATLAPAERDRVEMLVLSDAGWSAPRIATHLGCHAVTVRSVLKRFGEVGAASVRRGRPGPPPDTARRAQVTAALDALLSQERTWTAGQLAAALGEQGIALSRRQTRKYLQGMGARWRRTVRTVKHKQDPVRAAQAVDDLAAYKKKPRRARSA